MKIKTALTVVSSVLCVSLLAGCSYFPAIKLPEGKTIADFDPEDMPVVMNGEE